MLVSVLCSGSEGNCTFIQTKDHNILIDLGMNTKYLTSKLEEIGIKREDIDIVCITHTHSDHISSLKTFFKKDKPVILLDPKMMTDLDFLNDYPNLVFDTKDLVFGNTIIDIVKTSHDAPGSRAYIIKEDDKSVVYITDTGYINHKNFELLSNHNLYIFEANHNVEMLMHGRYPAWLKKRVRGDEGHLSNDQAGFYLSKLIGDKTKTVILAHLSKENNTPDIALAEVRAIVKDNGVDFDNYVIATQRERTELIEV